MHEQPQLTRRELLRSAAVSALAACAALSADGQGDRGARRPGPSKRAGMYVSIRDEILMAGGFASVAEGLRASGINGVEIAVSRDYSVRAITPTTERPRLKLDDDQDVARLKDQLAAADARLSGFLLPNNFGAKDLDSELAWVVRVVQVAGRLGCPAIRIDSNMEGGSELSLQEREDLFARCVKHILDATKGVPVDLGIENHGVKGNDPDFLLGLIRKVGSPRLGVTMDTGNFYWAGYPLDELYTVLKRLAPYAKHTHVKNIRYPEEMRTKRREPGYEYGKYVCPIPEGDIDLKKVVGFLKAAGYRRDLCIEDESLGKYDEATRRANISAAGEFLQKLV